MKAIQVVLAYAKLPPEEMAEANELMSILSRERHALSLLQKEMLEVAGDARSEMGEIPSDNVVHGVFGSSVKPAIKRGRKPLPNGPLELALSYMKTHPNGSCWEFKEHALKINPLASSSSLSNAYYKVRRRAA